MTSQAPHTGNYGKRRKLPKGRVNYWTKKNNVFINEFYYGSDFYISSSKYRVAL